MNYSYSCIVSPLDGSELILRDGSLVDSSGNSFPIIDNIPRFVNASNYSTDFGKQWNIFPQTQLDSYSGLDISKSRLARCFCGNLPGIKDKLVLEAGSGAGRFTEHLLSYGAIVHSFDYSNAVEANCKNNGDSPRLTLVQADIRNMPFRKAEYDFVVCLGVLQHTPSPEESIKSLWEMVKPGGFLIADHYIRKWRIILPPPIGQVLGLYRFFILRLPQDLRFDVVRRLTKFWFPVHWWLRNSWVGTRILRRVSPVIFHYPGLGLHNKKMYYNWSLLDTHDSTTDFYKHYRSVNQIRKFLDSLGATEIVLSEGGNGIEIFCKK